MIFFSEFYNFTNHENNLKLDELVSMYAVATKEIL